MKEGRSQETGVRSQNKVGAGFEDNIVLMSKILLNPLPQKESGDRSQEGKE